MPFMPNVFNKSSVKGVIGTHPRRLPIEDNEGRVVGEITILKSDEVPQGYQVFWRDGALLGVCNIGEQMPMVKGERPADSITFNPEDYEAIVASLLRQAERYRSARAPLPYQKYPDAIEALRRHRGTRH